VERERSARTVTFRPFRPAAARNGPGDVRETMLRFIRRVLRPAACGLALAFGLTACAVDDSSLEAKLEKAQIAIDAGNYAAAEAILLALCPVLATCADNILALLGEAQMGAGGVDVLTLIAAMDGLATAGDDTAVFDVINAMFGSDGITAAEVANLNDAITTLQLIASPTADDDLQLATAAAAHMVGSVILQTDPDNDGVYDGGLVDSTLAASVTSDLVLVSSSAAAVDAFLAGTTDTTTDLSGLTEDVEGTGGDGVIDATELSTFVGTL